MPSPRATTKTNRSFDHFGYVTNANVGHRPAEKHRRKVQTLRLCFFWVWFLTRLDANRQKVPTQDRIAPIQGV